MSSSMNVHSVSAELATVARKTRGTVPPKLVGASTTVVGDKMYLFGGRLVVERRMLSDIYVFDMQTYTWDKLEPTPESILPGSRYFHSADVWNNHLVIFGGMGYQSPEQPQETLCVLNDVCFFSIAESRWLPPDESPPPTQLSPAQSLVPRARYAHLSSVSSDTLFIIGGQDLANGWMDDIHVYDLPSRTWVHRSDYPRHCGTYRSVALSAPLRVRDPSTDPLPPPAQRFRSDRAPAILPVTPPETFIELPYSTPSTPNAPSDIYLYSNYNFTDVKRELEVFTPQPPSTAFSVVDRSDAMTGSSLPPGLRFPTGALLGTCLIIAGTYLAHSYQAFSIWSLDLTTMSWSRIEPGNALNSGSWCRAVLWRESNKFLVFGNREGNLVEDYNHRLLSWDHVAYIDLEAYGIYQPPSPGLGLGREAQAMGLAALEDGAFADFEIICDDGRKIPCSRKLLEDRWTWFRDQRRRYLAAAASTSETSGTNPVPPMPVLNASDPILPRPDPRLTPRTLHLTEPYPVVIAFLQYLYAQTLLTPLQHAPAVLSSLMLLSSTYNMAHLRDLVTHAMHRALNVSRQGVSGVYDVATLCDCQSLRLRAMRMFKDIKKAGRSRPGRPDHERHGGGSSGSHGGRSSGNHHHHARPRGMSDAHQTQPGSGASTGGESMHYTTGQTNGVTHTIVNRQDNNTSKTTLMRRPSRKSSLGRISDLEPVEEYPSTPTPFYGMETSSRSSNGISDFMANFISEDEDFYDFELLGLDTSLTNEERSSTPSLHTRISHNARPSLSRSSSSSRQDQEDYFFGTEPDQSPLTSSFPAPAQTPAYHLPYSLAHRASRSASFSDAPSLEESRSFSTHSSAPVTPLSPALAEIVDAVAKIAVTQPEVRLSRQISMRSTYEQTISSDDQRPSIDSSSDYQASISHFPLPPQESHSHQKLPKIKTSLSNISETESVRSPDWMQQRESPRVYSTMCSPGASSITSFDMVGSGTSTRSISRKSSYDMLTDRHSSMTPVQQMSGTFTRFLSSKRSISALEKEASKAHIKAEKLKLEIQGRGDRGRTRSLSDRDSPSLSIFSNLWSPKSPKFGRSEEKKKKKEVEKEKLREITEEVRSRADSRTFENKVGIAQEKWAVPVAAVGGL